MKKECIIKRQTLGIKARKGQVNWKEWVSIFPRKKGGNHLTGFVCFDFPLIKQPFSISFPCRFSRPDRSVHGWGTRHTNPRVLQSEPSLCSQLSSSFSVLGNRYFPYVYGYRNWSLALWWQNQTLLTLHPITITEHTHAQGSGESSHQCCKEVQENEDWANLLMVSGLGDFSAKKPVRSQTVLH